LETAPFYKVIETGIPFESLCAVTYSPSIVTMALYYGLRDKATYSSKIANFLYHTCKAPPKKVTLTPSEFREDV